jgi:hypothetical protein
MFRSPATESARAASGRDRAHEASRRRIGPGGSRTPQAHSCCGGRTMCAKPTRRPSSSATTAAIGLVLIEEPFTGHLCHHIRRRRPTARAIGMLVCPDPQPVRAISRRTGRTGTGSVRMPVVSFKDAAKNPSPSRGSTFESLPPMCFIGKILNVSLCSRLGRLKIDKEILGSVTPSSSMGRIPLPYRNELERFDSGPPITVEDRVRPPLCARMDETVPPSEITVEGGKGYSHGRAG